MADTHNTDTDIRNVYTFIHTTGEQLHDDSKRNNDGLVIVEFDDHILLHHSLDLEDEPEALNMSHLPSRQHRNVMVAAMVEVYLTHTRSQTPNTEATC